MEKTQSGIPGINSIMDDAANNATAEDVWKIELDPSKKCSKEELDEIKNVIISSRGWFQDLEARKSRLSNIMAAQEKIYMQLRQRRQMEIAELMKIAEAGEAVVKLMTGYHKPEEKDELIEKVKGEKLFEEKYNNYAKIQKQHEIIQRIAEFQQKKIEELKVERTTLHEELRETRERFSWKKIFLSLYCARTEED